MFTPALEAGVAKIKTYYDKTSACSAYNLSMGTFHYPPLPFVLCLILEHIVLDPEMKTSYFKKHWGNSLEQKARDDAEDIVSDSICLFSSVLLTQI